MQRALGSALQSRFCRTSCRRLDTSRPIADISNRSEPMDSMESRCLSSPARFRQIIFAPCRLYSSRYASCPQVVCSRPPHCRTAYTSCNVWIARISGCWPRNFQSVRHVWDGLQLDIDMFQGSSILRTDGEGDPINLLYPICKEIPTLLTKVIRAYPISTRYLCTIFGPWDCGGAHVSASATLCDSEILYHDG